jgi:hypothetical protein
LTGKRVNPHALWHSRGDGRQNGINQAIIALWLAYESVETMLVLCVCRPAPPGKALARMRPGPADTPDDALLAFLESL